MSYLLDTHAFLWAVFSPDKLSRRARATIADPSNAVNLSSITLWEISLKFALGKLTLKNATPEEMVAVAREMGLALIGLSAEESASFHQLPSAAHRDPFDRMLAWQAIQRKLVLVTKDGALPVYQDAGLKTLW
ncbi:MAG: type II toxin-antitoxin system VapC family toxin [Betaproteobacteria bacterium]|nr:type II toxin-antitoxin system VapC family toxin [Betaproteobacteria bacterium]